MTHSVGQDAKNISYRVWNIGQPKLGLSREYLIKGLEDKDVQHYYKYMVESAKLMGSEKAEKEKMVAKNHAAKEKEPILKLRKVTGDDYNLLGVESNWNSFEIHSIR